MTKCIVCHKSLCPSQYVDNSGLLNWTMTVDGPICSDCDGGSNE